MEAIATNAAPTSQATTAPAQAQASRWLDETGPYSIGPVCKRHAAELHDIATQIRTAIKEKRPDDAQILRDQQSDLERVSLVDYADQLRQRDRAEAEQAGKKAADAAKQVTQAGKLPPNSQSRPYGVNARTIADLRARASIASPSERALFDFIQSQVESGAPIASVLADADIRGAVARSKLVQDLVEAYGGPRAPRDGDVDPPLTAEEKRQVAQNAGSPTRQRFIDDLRRRLDAREITVEEITADPHIRAEMRVDPGLRELIETYRRKQW